MTIKCDRIAIARTDGSVAVMSIIVDAPLSAFDPPSAAANGFKLVGERWRRAVNNSVIEAEIVRAGIVDATDWRRVQEKDIPTDRQFRDAWKPDLTVDMEKAREIHKNRLRRLRVPLLGELDIAYQRADEVGDAAEKQRIAEKKQALRDVTALPAIAEAKTPEALAAVMPKVLLGR